MVSVRFIDHWAIAFSATFFDVRIIINLSVTCVNAYSSLHINRHPITNITTEIYNGYCATYHCPNKLIILVGNFSHYIFAAVASSVKIVSCYFSKYVLRNDYTANLTQFMRESR